MNKKVCSYILCVFASLCLVVFSSCNQKPSDDNSTGAGKDKVYKGTVNIAVDASLEPVMKQEEEIFEFAYDSVNANIIYENESEVISDFASKKATVMVVARDLTEEEKNKLISRDSIYVREVNVAYDAVALIGNLNFDDSKLSIDDLKKYFSPENSSANSPKMVFENQNSSTVKFVMNLLGYKEKVSPNVFAAKNTEAVIDYVEQSNNTIGFVPFSYLSDAEDERVITILKRIKILSLRSQNEKGEEIITIANQSEIADGSYPLTRKVNAVSHYDRKDDLNWLFVNFLYQNKGAKIFLRAGLVPGKMPNREINVNTGETKDNE